MNEIKARKAIIKMLKDLGAKSITIAPDGKSTADFTEQLPVPYIPPLPVYPPGQYPPNFPDPWIPRHPPIDLGGVYAYMAPGTQPPGTSAPWKTRIGCSPEERRAAKCIPPRAAKCIPLMEAYGLGGSVYCAHSYDICAFGEAFLKRKGTPSDAPSSGG